MNYNTNLFYLKLEIEKITSDAVIISMYNTFNNVNDIMSDICFISGFTGSNGLCFISQNQNVLFIDGRYIAQAKEQIDTVFWQIEEQSNINRQFDSVEKIVNKFLQPKQTLGICEFSWNYATFLSLEKHLKNIDCQLKMMQKFNIFSKKPRDPSSCFLCCMDEQDMGESRLSRINKIQNTTKAPIIITESMLLGWTFGIRKLPFSTNKNPLAKCLAIINDDQNIILFSDLQFANSQSDLKYSNSNFIDQSAMIPNCNLYHINNFEKYIIQLKTKNIVIDYKTIPIFFAMILKKHGFSLLQLENKSKFVITKNSKEIFNAKKAADKTAIAFIKTIVFIEQNKDITESDIVNYFCNEIRFFETAIDFSFEPIIAFGKNTKFPHYNYKTAAKQTKILSEELVLFDAGFHFQNSTTDVTRTIYVGDNPKDEFINIYTIVLKAFIMFSTAKVPDKTKASSADLLARYYIWQINENYFYSTGHGVGAFGKVHEPPFISPQSNFEISENMIFTVEPGVYNDKFGIRLENMLLTVKNANNFLHFETISYIPFCKKLIDQAQLTNFERDWINIYHFNIYEKFSQHFHKDQEVLDWLTINTEKI